MKKKIVEQKRSIFYQEQIQEENSSLNNFKIPESCKNAKMTEPHKKTKTTEPHKNTKTTEPHKNTKMTEPHKNTASLKEPRKSAKMTEPHKNTASLKEPRKSAKLTEQSENKKITESHKNKKMTEPHKNIASLKESHRNKKLIKKQKRNADIKAGIKKKKIEDNTKEQNNNSLTKTGQIQKTSTDALSKKNKSEGIGVKLSKLEKELLHKGTIKDKINLLTLLVEKNPSEFNYKNLLFYTENQRNDIIYLTLKNIKDLLLSKGVPESNYIKQRITKCFEINVKNTFIKTKVIRLVYDLLKNDILFLDLIYSFINKIGDKKEIEAYICENLRPLFFINEEAILYNIEDFICKNMNFKCINSILKFLRCVSPTDKCKMIEIYKLILDHISEFKDEQKNIILERSLEQFSALLEEIDDPTIFVNKEIEDLIKVSYATDKMAFSGVKILFRCQCKILKPFIVQLLKNHIFFNFKDIRNVFQFILQIYKKDKDNEFIKNILSSIIFYKKDLLIAILLLCAKNRISNVSVLEILKNHYSNIVRKMVNSILTKEYNVIEINPFDKLQLEAYEEVYK